MSVNTNLTQVNVNPGQDTNKYFNNYFTPPFDVSVSENDSIVSFFQTITDNQESALALASAVIYTSKLQGIDVMSMLDEFKKYSKSQLDSYLCMFLNLNRVGTSLLGVSNAPLNNPYVNRCILP